MNNTKLYEKLAKHLDQGVLGSPRSPALMEIIKILFPVEDAEIALNLPMRNRPLSELKELFPEKAGSLEEILNRMAKRGTVFTSQRPGQERKYRLRGLYRNMYHRGRGPHPTQGDRATARDLGIPGRKIQRGVVHPAIRRGWYHSLGFIEI